MYQVIIGSALLIGSLVGLGLNHKKRVKKESRIHRIKRNIKVKGWKVIK